METGVQEEKLLEQGENQQQTKPIYGTRPEYDYEYGNCWLLFDKKVNTCLVAQILFSYYT